MAHLFDSGFSVREPSWHGLATVLDSYPRGWADARTAAGLDWEAESRPLPVLNWDEHGSPEILRTPTGSPVIDPDWKAIVRSDTNARLAITRDSYEVISMKDFGGIFEAVLEQTNVKFETAGSLDAGRAVWALAYLDEPIRIGEDPSATVPYLLLLSRHDGTAAAKLIPTSIRVICQNTAKAAEWEGKQHGAVYAFRHTSGWRNRVNEARDAVTKSRSAMARYRAMAEELYGFTVTPAQFDWFVDQFLPLPATGVSEREREKVLAARDKLRVLSMEETNADVAHTAYGLVQIGTEYLDHVRPWRSSASHFSRTMVTVDKHKHRLVGLAREAAAVAV
jgi:phage/plasmid-like protein (TIGR03299 family)